MGDAIGRVCGPLPDPVLILTAIVFEATVEIGQLVEIVFAFITVEIEVIVGERLITGGSSPRADACVEIKLLEGFTKDQELEQSTLIAWLGEKDNALGAIGHGSNKLVAGPEVFLFDDGFHDDVCKFLPDVIVIKVGIGGTGWSTGGWIPAIKSKGHILLRIILRQGRLEDNGITAVVWI